MFRVNIQFERQKCDSCRINKITHFNTIFLQVRRGNISRSYYSIIFIFTITSYLCVSVYASFRLVSSHLIFASFLYFKMYSCLYFRPILLNNKAILSSNLLFIAQVYGTHSIITATATTTKTTQLYDTHIVIYGMNYALGSICNMR